MSEDPVLTEITPVSHENNANRLHPLRYVFAWVLSTLSGAFRLAAKLFEAPEQE